MAIQTIKESELAAVAVASLPSRPNAQPQFGGRGYTAKELKEAFDRLPRLIAERLNALIDDIYSGELSEVLAVSGTGESLLSLAEELRTAIETLQGEMGALTDASNATHTAFQKDITTLLGLRLVCDSRNFVLSLVGGDGAPMSQIDLPLESMVTHAGYDSEARAIVLTLQNGESIAVGVSELVEGLVSTDALAIALAGKQDTLVWDEMPTLGSAQPVTSDGVQKALMQTKVDTLAEAQSLLSAYASKEDMQEEIGRLWGALAQTVLTEETVEDTYSLRKTARGEQVVDAAKTALLTIAGDTIPLESGFSHASITGIESFGSNLFPLVSRNKFATIKDDVTVALNANPQKIYLIAASTMDETGNITPYLESGETYVLSQSKYFPAFDTPGAIYWRLVLHGIDGKESVKTSHNKALTFTADFSLYSKFVLEVQTGTTSGYEGEEVTFSCARVGATDTTYRKDSISWDSVILGKWDYIDVEAQEVVYTTCETAQDTPFTEEALALYDDYILSLDGCHIAYPSMTPRREPIQIPPTYLAYYLGEERLLPFGTTATVTQKYYIRGESI